MALSGPEPGLTACQPQGPSVAVNPRITQNHGMERRNTTISRAPGRRAPPSTRYGHGRGRFFCEIASRAPQGSGTERAHFPLPIARAGFKRARSRLWQTGTVYLACLGRMNPGSSLPIPLSAAPMTRRPGPSAAPRRQRQSKGRSPGLIRAQHAKAPVRRAVILPYLALLAGAPRPPRATGTNEAGLSAKEVIGSLEARGRNGNIFGSQPLGAAPKRL